MADEQKDTANDEKLEEAFEQLESNAGPDVVEPRVKKSGGGGAFLAVLLSLVAIGIAAYPAWEMYQQRLASPVANPLAAEVQALRTQASEQQRRTTSQIQTISDRLDQLASAGKSDTTETSSLKRYLEQELESIRARLGSSAQDWVTAEVEYLIRMANQAVLIERDANAAVQMLEAADAIIQQTQGFTAHNLRGVLAKDILALRAVATPDTQGIYLELSAMIGQIKQLQQKLPRFKAEPLPASTDNEAASFSEKMLTIASNSGARLANLVDFRRNTVSITPILPPNEAYYLRQNLVLKVQLAQLALLEGNESAYQASLIEAARWLEDSFGSDDAMPSTLRSALLRLSEESIAQDLPDISGSLAEVRRHVAAVHTQVTMNPAPAVTVDASTNPTIPAKAEAMINEEVLPE